MTHQTPGAQTFTPAQSFTKEELLGNAAAIRLGDNEEARAGDIAQMD